MCKGGERLIIIIMQESSGLPLLPLYGIIIKSDLGLIDANGPLFFSIINGPFAVATGGD